MGMSNSMVAHVWANQSKEEGKSSNGNFYFRGRTLYSYGSHYVAGFMMPDGTAVLNAKSYSISTNGHQSDAARAVRGSYFYCPDLTEIHYLLERIADGTVDRKSLRNDLVRHADLLTRTRNAYRWQDEDDGEAEQLGAYLARVAGLRPNAWPAIAKEAAKRRAAKLRESERLDARRAEALALHYANMTDQAWREHMRKDSSKYECFYDQEAKALYHAVRLAKAKKWSAKRQSILKARRADALLRRKAGYDGAAKSYKRWNDVRYNIGRIRSCREQFAVETLTPPTRLAVTRTAIDCLNALSGCAAFPSQSRFKMRSEATRLGYTLARLRTEADAYERAEREREEAERAEAERIYALERAEQIAAWYDGANIRLRFNAESGGAALRIKADVLQTSHGAEVPLSHAIKAFRFVKLCRDRGEDWTRNGKVIRVGHFQIDSISASGDFRAGCHHFTWPEIERAAKAAGVADETGDDSAVEKVA